MDLHLTWWQLALLTDLVLWLVLSARYVRGSGFGLLACCTYDIIYGQNGWLIRDTVRVWALFGLFAIYVQRVERSRRGTLVDEVLRQKVFRRDDWECLYCASSTPGELTVNHILPQKDGGPSHPSNLVTACRRCNSMKQGRTPEDANMPLLYGRFFCGQFDWMPVGVDLWRSRRHFVDWHAQHRAYRQRLMELADRMQRGDEAAKTSYQSESATGFVYQQQPGGDRRLLVGS